MVTAIAVAATVAVAEAVGVALGVAGGVAVGIAVAIAVTVAMVIVVAIVVHSDIQNLGLVSARVLSSVMYAYILPQKSLDNVIQNLAFVS
jgi:hypothetical protein